MLTIEQLKKSIPEARDIPDEELAELRNTLYAIIERILDQYIENFAKIEI
jgi:hypothetical protein